MADSVKSGNAVIHQIEQNNSSNSNTNTNIQTPKSLQESSIAETAFVQKKRVFENYTTSNSSNSHSRQASFHDTPIALGIVRQMTERLSALELNNNNSNHTSPAVSTAPRRFSVGHASISSESSTTKRVGIQELKDGVEEKKKLKSPPPEKVDSPVVFRKKEDNETKANEGETKEKESKQENENVVDIQQNMNMIYNSALYSVPFESNSSTLSRSISVRRHSIDTTSLHSASSSSQITRADRRHYSRSRRHDRTTEHINAFHSLQIQSTSHDLVLDLVIHQNQTIEQLAWQIEAEWAVRTARQKKMTWQMFLQTSPVLLEVGALMDAQGKVLPFSEKVENVLNREDVVHVLDLGNVPESSTSPTRRRASLAEMETMNKMTAASRRASLGNTLQVLESAGEEFNQDRFSTTDRASIMGLADQRTESLVSVSYDDALFDSILRNGIALSHFKEFCLHEHAIESLLFWLEVEAWHQTSGAHQLLTAKYIYLLYVDKTAPLQVNLTREQRPPFPAQVNPLLFDEAQSAVYETMKGLLLGRFLSSICYQQFQTFCNLEPEKCQREWIQNYYDYFKPPYESMFVILNADTANYFTDPQQCTQQVKEMLLTGALSRYFPVSTSLAGYFDQSAPRLQRARKQQKEKRLVKFFGAKLDQTWLQNQVIENEPEENEEMEDHENKEMLEDEHESNMNRKKKVDKLTDFFGDKVPRQQLAVQVQITPASAIVSQAESQSENENISGSFNEIMRPAMPTVNAMNQKDKVLLTKRNKKLAGVLGEALSEDVVQRTVVAPMKRAALAHSASTALQMDKVEPNSNEQVSNTNDANGETHLSKRAQRRLRRRTLSGENGNNANNNTDTNSLQSSLQSSHSHSDSFDDSNPSKEERRRRLEKLQKFLGERLSERLLEEQREEQARRVPSAQAPLSQSEKKNQMRRVTKLERVFGSMPPPEMIQALRSENGVDHKNSIVSLAYLVQNERDMVELIDYMRQYDANPTLQPTAANPAQRTRRQKKFNKLQRFFGDAAPDQLFEQSVLQILEQSIEDSYTGRDLEEMKANLQRIRTQVRTSMANIQQNEETDETLKE